MCSKVQLCFNILLHIENQFHDKISFYFVSDAAREFEKIESI